MKTRILWGVCILPLALALGCKDDSPPKDQASQPPPTPSHVFKSPNAQPEMPPSQSELDAKASKEINEKNADAEFEKLKQEIEGGG